MTYSIHINQFKAMEWELSNGACFLMSKMVDLSSWADTVTTKDGKVYYLLFKSKIMEDIPLIGSKNTVSRAIVELESKKLIESTHKATTPAYRLTAKGKEWINSVKKSNDGEKQKSKYHKKQDTKPKEFTFTLSSLTAYENLKDLYKENLKKLCVSHAKKIGVPTEEYNSYIENHFTKGIKLKDWAMGFNTWCKGYKRINKISNDGEKF